MRKLSARTGNAPVSQHPDTGADLIRLELKVDVPPGIVAERLEQALADLAWSAGGTLGRTELALAGRKQRALRSEAVVTAGNGTVTPLFSSRRADPSDVA